MTNPSQEGLKSWELSQQDKAVNSIINKYEDLIAQEKAIVKVRELEKERNQELEDLFFGELEENGNP